jgi:glycerophosphoryl diester phosphodiesterase
MKIIGHRGAKGLAPENTLASFKKAIEHNVAEIETDAHITADGIVVLTHDPVMHLPDGSKHKIIEKTYAELLELKPDLTTLEQAVAFVDRKVPFMIEVKPGVDVVPILNYIKDMRSRGWAISDLTMASEDFSILQTAHDTLPDLELSLVEEWSGVRASFRARKLGITRLSMNYRVLWSGFVKPMIRRGYVISAYTVNKPKTAARLRKYGVQAIFTDQPDLFESK